MKVKLSCLCTIGQAYYINITVSGFLTIIKKLGNIFKIAEKQSEKISLTLNRLEVISEANIRRKTNKTVCESNIKERKK